MIAKDSLFISKWKKVILKNDGSFGVTILYVYDDSSSANFNSDYLELDNLVFFYNDYYKISSK